MLKTAAAEFPNRVFVAGKGDDTWHPRTFPQLREEARALAAGLLDAGIAEGTTMAILSEGSPQWVAAEFATLMTGGTSVPLSIRLLPNEVPFRLNHSEAGVLFLSRNTLDKVLEVLDEVKTRTFTVVYLDEDKDHFYAAVEERGLKPGRQAFLYKDLVARGRTLDSAPRLDEIEAGAEEDDVVTISYTSGTTGNPKGIMLTNQNYYVNCKDAVEFFQVPYDYQTLVILPCDHSFAHTVGIYAALFRGISLYFVDGRGGPMGMLRNIPVNLKETNPTFILSVPALSGNFMKKILSGVEEKGGIPQALFTAGIRAGIRYWGDGHRRPTFLKRALNALPYRLADAVVFNRIRGIFGENIRFFVGGGALLERSQQEFFRALGVPIYQGYGLTEAAPVISSNCPREYKLGTSGKVFPSVECRILSPDGQVLPQGTQGEICVRGENVMKGYLKNEQATREAIRDGWLHTGDIGYFDEDGFLVVSGREKSLLISADGEKYSPEEIEEAIVNGSRYVHQAIVYNDHQKYTTALIVPDTEAVKQYLANHPDAGAADLLDLFHEHLHSFRTDPKYKNRFPSQWVPATFQLLVEPFSEKNHLINSTGKMVRFKVVETYRELLLFMYTDDGSTYRNEKNIEAVRRLFGVLD
jgi:long-chain acyl-CoA synthetase